jgi:hypothetical protein
VTELPEGYTEPELAPGQDPDGVGLIAPGGDYIPASPPPVLGEPVWMDPPPEAKVPPVATLR